MDERRWRMGCPEQPDRIVVYSDAEVALVEQLVARAAAGERVREAAAEWNVLHLLKAELDAEERVAAPVANQARPCLSPKMCTIYGCTGVCQWQPGATDPSAGAGLDHVAADGDLFVAPTPVEAVAG